jgi:mannose-6-phosphate isomerase-like protein (cupin superfamily)
MTGEPVVIGPGEGECIGRALILGGREEFVLTEFNYPPGADGPRRHIHRHHADGFYVLDGQLGITLDEEDLVLEPGACVVIPPEVIHTFRNPDPERPGRYLNFHAPGCGFDEYMRGNKPDFDQDYDVPPGSGRPTEEAALRQPGEGEELAIGPSRAIVKAGAPDGMGSLTILDSTAAPGFPGPRLHVHDHTVDSFFVIEGTLTVQLDGKQEEAPAGSYVLIPPGNAHTFSNPGDGPVRFLNVMAPGGFEGYLREAAAQGGPPSDETAAKYDFRAI